MSDDLSARALAARAMAYAPYSGYAVGAALRTRDGQVFVGANVENASYGLSVCAERTAIFAAVLAGARELDSIAIATDSSPPASPCGMCLQTMAEFAPDLSVTLVNGRGEQVACRLVDLIPRAFRPKDLAR
jgi:cytidine deaminase